MKRWLSYILMAVLCSLYLSSCAKDEEVAKATDGGKVPVRLTLAFSNFGGRAASEPGDLDYTTVEQSAMTADDVYVLVVDANDNFLYQVQDLKLGNPVEGDNYYTRQLEGTMLRTVGGEQVKLVVLANLKDNKIASYTTGAAIRNFLETKKGSNIAKVYKELVYHYGGSTIPWKLAERAIPMWGSSNLTAVRYGSGLGLQPLSCCSKGGHLGEYAGWISRIHYHKDNSEQCQRQRLLCFNGNSKSGGNGSIYISFYSCRSTESDYYL